MNDIEQLHRRISKLEDQVLSQALLMQELAIIHRSKSEQLDIEIAKLSLRVNKIEQAITQLKIFNLGG